MIYLHEIRIGHGRLVHYILWGVTYGGWSPTNVR